MEKLQPLIKHKFWIIAGMSLLLPFVGWWLSTGKVAAAIQSRWDTLSALNVPSGSGTPNEDYIKKIDAVIETLAERQSKLDSDLYEKQKSLHTWPEHVAKHMDDKQFREPVSDTVLRVFANYHRGEIRGMLKDLPAYEFDPETGQESGIVFCAQGIDTIPHGPVWQNKPPTSEVMWDTQEDVWLTRAILNAIKDVNSDAGATKITDAPIRILYRIELRGGSRPEEAAVGGAATGDGEGEYNPPSYEAEGDTDDGYATGSRFSGQMAMNLDDIFGPQTVQLAGGDDEGSSVPYDGDTGSGAALRRYVDDKPELPYKTRGFYVEILMMHDRLPDLQASLVSMPWPTELLMIHQTSDQVDMILPVMDATGDNNLPPGFRGGSGSRGGIQNRTTFPRRGFTGGRGGGGGRGGFGGGATTRFGASPRFGGGSGFGGGGRGGSGFGGGGRGGSGFGGGRGGSGFGGGQRFSPPTRSFGPVGPMGPMGPMGDDGEGFQQQETSFETAMKDFYLTKIGIAGLMTIYRSPEELAANKGVEAEPNLDPSPEQLQSDPGAIEPGAIEPGVTEPGVTEPGVTEPGVTEPGVTEPGVTEPGVTEPGVTEPGATEPGATEPGVTEPGAAEPPTVDPMSDPDAGTVPDPQAGDPPTDESEDSDSPMESADDTEAPPAEESPPAADGTGPPNR